MTRSTSLQFAGDIPVWTALGISLGAALLVFWLYRRETKRREDRYAWQLPLLRAAAVFLALFALAGPILRHERVIRELGQLFVFVDDSDSMSLTDGQMSPEGKIAVLRALGDLPRDDSLKAIDTAAAQLARASSSARLAMRGGAELPLAGSRLEDAITHLEEASKSLKKADLDFSQLSAPSRGFVRVDIWKGERRGEILDPDRRRNSGQLSPPTETKYLEGFALPMTTDTEFTAWFRGYIVAPKKGKYTFWVSSDDRSSLLISRDASRARAKEIAKVDGYVEVGKFDVQSSQKSRILPMKAGDRHFLEAVLEAGPGENHLSVAWSVDGGPRKIVGGESLMPWTDGESTDKSGGEAIVSFVDSVLKEASDLHEKATSNRGINPIEFDDRLEELAENVGTWHDRLRDYVLGNAAIYYAKHRDDPALQKQLEVFDATTRRDRITRLLLDEDTGLLRQLTRNQDVELMVLSGNKAEEVWWQRRGGRKQAGPIPASIIEGDGQSQLTNLTDPVRQSLGRESDGVAALVLSDGQHNAGSPPQLLGEELGDLGVPVFAIGFGGEISPGDMALVAVKAPEAAYFKDRIRGEVRLSDNMPGGIGYKIVISEKDGEILWEKEVESNGSGQRLIPFQFNLQALAEARREEAQERDGIDLRAIPIHLDARIELIDEIGEGSEEAIADNNARPFFVRATTQKRKVLIIDARPRWEMRYIGSLFERDERWEVNSLIEFLAPGEKLRSWTRGDEVGQFPGSKSELFSYDLIVLGEVSPSLFRPGEIEWLEQFVSQRGGGLIAIDGQRGHLREHRRTALGKAVPVEWLPPQGVDKPAKFILTESGRRQPWLQIGATEGESDSLWRDMPVPHWSASVKALPGTETLVEVQVGGEKRPVFVSRRYGAGKVLYSAVDEWWRWRYDVGDLHHGRLWNQATQWACEPPFAVQGKFVSLATDRFAVDPGDTVFLRARIRNDAGKPVDEGDFVAVVTNKEDDTIIAEVELAPDANSGGIFRGRTPPLAPGVHEISIRPKYDGAGNKDYAARTEVVVGALQGHEFDSLALNRESLESITEGSQGHFFYEDEALQLPELLESIDRKRVIASETTLWSSYWWFLPIMFLLTGEWVMRKKAGML